MTFKKLKIVVGFSLILFILVFSVVVAIGLTSTTDTNPDSNIAAIISKNDPLAPIQIDVPQDLPPKDTSHINDPSNIFYEPPATVAPAKPKPVVAPTPAPTQPPAPPAPVIVQKRKTRAS